MDDSGDQTQTARDVATVLPFVAAVLLISPLIVAFSAPVNLFGVPLIVVYLFSVWVVIIAVAFAVARRLDRAEQAEAERESGAADE